MTPSQNKLLKAITAHLKDRAVPPTITLMAEKFRIRVPSAWERFKALERLGYLKRRSDRLYWPTGKASRVSPCPCCGHKEEQG